MKKIIFLMLFAIIGWQQAGAQDFTFGGLNYNVTSPTTVEVGNQNSAVAGNVIIPAQVTDNGNTYQVTSISDSAFLNCISLTSVIIPNSVASIGVTAIAVCPSLTSIIIPNSVISIGYGAFSYCTNLTSITIPNSITSIGNYAFYNCHSLTSVSIPYGITSIGMGTFLYCSLTSVTIPNSVTSIGSNAFGGCSNLTSVTIPNMVTSIDSAAFYGCNSLTAITIPNSVNSIGDQAFGGCTGLTSVTVNWSTPLAINNSIFQNVNTSPIVLNVPNGTASIYDATAVWTDFIINDALSVMHFSVTNGFDLIAYPNPSNNVFNFKVNGANDETVSLLVFDMTGRHIENKMVNANDIKNITLGQNYSSGVYNVLVAQGRNTKMVRLIKE